MTNTANQAKEETSLTRSLLSAGSSIDLPHLSLRLSTDEAELLYHLDLSGVPKAKKTKFAIAKQLAEVYSHGNQEVTADHWKAQTYAIKADESLTKEQQTAEVNKLDEWNIKRTQSWYAGLGWFTSVRLFYVRSARVFLLIGRALVSAARARLIAIAGLSYGLELVIDIGVVVKNVLNPSKGEEHLHWTQLTINSLKKDNRWYRMANAAIWFAINLAAFILTGGMSVILNLVGFSLDPVNEVALAGLEIDKNNELLKKNNARLTEIETAIEKHTIPTKDWDRYIRLQLLHNELHEKINRLEEKIKTEKDSTKKAAFTTERNQLNTQLDARKPTLIQAILTLKVDPDLLQQHNELSVAKLKLEQANTALKKSKIHTVLTVCGVLLGMFLIAYLPTGIPLIAAAIFVVAAGSIFGGLGRRVYGKKDNIRDFFVNAWYSLKNYLSTPNNEPVPTPVITVVPAPIPITTLIPAPIHTNDIPHVPLHKSSSAADLPCSASIDIIKQSYSSNNLTDDTTIPGSGKITPPPFTPSPLNEASSLSTTPSPTSPNTITTPRSTPPSPQRSTVFSLQLLSIDQKNKMGNATPTSKEDRTSKKPCTRKLFNSSSERLNLNRFKPIEQAIQEGSGQEEDDNVLESTPTNATPRPNKHYSVPALQFISTTERNIRPYDVTATTLPAQHQP